MAGDIDWAGMFAQGVRWFHTGGIYTLISPTSGAVAIEAMEAAGKAGTFRSFDLNYRSKVEPDKDRARAQNQKIVGLTDFLVGNQSDFGDALGEECEKVSKDESFEVWLEAYSDMLYDVAEDKLHLAVTRENVEIADRTGGGDSFASGVAAALLQGNSIADAVQWGAAHGICVQSTPGDTTMVTQSDVVKEVKRAISGGGVSAMR